METNVKCYMCDRIATTREHVPPLCLFPESKDVKGLNFRNDLITVPSCDNHNSKKSKDDEFLMVSIAGIVGNNILGYHHTRTKINRALRRKSKEFLNKAVIRNYKEHVIKSKSGNLYPVLYGNPDHSRLINCFESIAYGLFLHEFNERFIGEVRIILGFLEHKDENSSTFLKFIKRKFELETRLLTEKGSNPEVFKYQYCSPDEYGLIGLKMTFYGGTDVYVSYLPKDKKQPYSLAMDLMNHGIDTVITLGEEEFRFNKK